MVNEGWSIALVLIGAILIQTKVLDPDKALFDVLTDYAMFGAVVFETMAVASIFMFRWKRPDADRPYRCIGYPWVPLFYVVCFIGLTANYFIDPLKRIEAYSGVAFSLLGAAVYWLFLRQK
jgi:amino acid transporter